MKRFFVNACIFIMLLHSDVSIATPNGKGKGKNDSNTPMTIYQSADLNFGDFITDGRGGHITITTQGSISYQGVTGYSGGRTPQPAQFEITGEAHKHYIVDLPKNIRIRHPSNRSMKVEDFTMDSQQGFVLDRHGRDVLRVGASLKITPNLPEGAYRGEFLVTVNYN